VLLNLRRLNFVHDSKPTPQSTRVLRIICYAAALESKDDVVHTLLGEIAALEAAQKESQAMAPALDAHNQDLGRQLSEATASSSEAAKRVVCCRFLLY